MGEEDGGAQLFNADRVRAALAYAAEKEAITTAEKAEKDAKRAISRDNRERKEIEAQGRAIQRQLDQELKAQAKVLKQAKKEAQKQQPKQLEKNKKKSLIVVLHYKRSSNSSSKVISFAKDIQVIGEGNRLNEEVLGKRQISLPQRFRS